MYKRISLGQVEAHVISKDSLRPCGPCTACCTALGVEEIHKPNYAPCQHLCDKGCGIYEDRPGSCRSFECWWRAGMVGGERPDKSGIIVDSVPAAVRVWEVKPGALGWKSNREVIRKLRKKYRTVIEGAADTWGKIWVETAAAAVKAAIREQQDIMGAIYKRVVNIMKAEKK
jgi:Fe-S-cluster containining protein